jgi:hypothetical protein
MLTHHSRCLSASRIIIGQRNSPLRSARGAGVSRLLSANSLPEEPKMEARRSTVIKSDEEIRTASEKRTKDGRVSARVAKKLRQFQEDLAKAQAKYEKSLGTGRRK